MKPDPSNLVIELLWMVKAYGAVKSGNSSGWVAFLRIFPLPILDSCSHKKAVILAKPRTKQMISLIDDNTAKSSRQIFELTKDPKHSAVWGHNILHLLQFHCESLQLSWRFCKTSWQIQSRPPDQSTLLQLWALNLSLAGSATCFPEFAIARCRVQRACAARPSWELHGKSFLELLDHWSYQVLSSTRRKYWKSLDVFGKRVIEGFVVVWSESPRESISTN